MAEVNLVNEWTNSGIECRLLRADGTFVGCAKVPDDLDIELTGDFEDVGWAIGGGFLDAAVYPRSGWVTSTLGLLGINGSDYPSDEGIAIERTNRLAGLLARHAEAIRQQREAEK